MLPRSLMLAIAVLAAPARAACPDFAPATAIPSTAFAAIAIATADFNDDGKVDFAVLHSNPQSGEAVLGVFLGNGEGAFTRQLPLYAVGADATSIAKGDFNNDQRIDLAVPAYTANTITLLLNRGDGTLNATTMAHSIVSFTAAADFNSDGNIDLAARRLNGTLWFHSGRGDGTFAAPVQSPPPASGGSMVPAHLDGDGKLDLVVLAPSGNTVRAMFGTGSGIFTAGPGPYTTGGSGARGIDIGDFDRDGRIDVAVAHQNSGDLSILLGMGGGEFGAPMKYPPGNTAWNALVRDFNRDGKLDVAVTNQFGNDVSLFVGNGNGTFAPALKYASPSGPLGLAAADFNGDGKLDLAVANGSSNNISILLSRDTCIPVSVRRRSVRR